jgi:hypothetical protein
MHATAIQRLVGARPAGGRRIELSFADGTKRVVDVQDRLVGPVFARIATDDDAFNELFFDAELGTVCWPGEVDLAPERLSGLPAV